MIRAAARQVRTIPLVEWPDIVAAAVWVLVVEVGIRLVPLPRLAGVLGVALDDGVPRQPPAGGRATATTRDRRLLRATGRVMRHWPFGDTCLRHALVLGRLLRRHGPVLHLGVAEVGGEVKAHAWLEIGGAVLDPLRAAGSYLRLEPIRSTDAA